MHQPIQWRQWGPEAFAAAQRENKPVLLDIGAVWCHWCHVMDRESYDDPGIAALVNAHYIPIKVDRDERPDVDSRYQSAIAAISGQGGWPLTAFLTAEGKPFYGGTYFPPADSQGRPSFKRVLSAIAEAYRERRNDILKEAEGLMAALSRAEGLGGLGADFNPGIVAVMVQSALSAFDPADGGFGSAPKFPHPSILELLLDWYARTGEQRVGEVVTTTLRKMANGGVYDQLAGGFHRYSVDERWIVPHFEKMSYDNSELLRNYVHAWQVTRDPFFADVARDIIRWVDSTLSDQEHGGFYASQDADINLEDDGDYFTWTMAEAHAVLERDEFMAAVAFYDIGERGEMHHNPAKNVLWVATTEDRLAERRGISVEKARALLASAKQKMLAARQQRPTPYIDKSLYVNWNAMFVSAYLAAARALALDDARRFALRTLDRILGEGWDPERGLPHVLSPSALPGLIDDYVFTAIACLDAYETTGDLSYFQFARDIADAALSRFSDNEHGGFFDREHTTEESIGALGIRRKAFQDAPTPAANPSAAILMMRLFSFTGDPKYRAKAEDTLEVFAGVADQFGIYAGTYGRAAVWLSRPETQVIVVGAESDATVLERAALQSYAENLSVVRVPQADPHLLPPALAETVPNVPGAKAGIALAIICSGFACRPPIVAPDELIAALRPALNHAA